MFFKDEIFHYLCVVFRDVFDEKVPHTREIANFKHSIYKARWTLHRNGGLSVRAYIQVLGDTY